MIRCRAKKTFTRQKKIQKFIPILYVPDRWHRWGIPVEVKVRIRNTIRCRKQVESHNSKPNLKHSGYGFEGEEITWQ